MSQRVYRRFTKIEQAELWKRWHQGESLGEIARGLGRHDSVIQTYFAKRGGLEPRKRTRRSNALTVEEREEISRGLATGRSCRWVAAQLGRAPSTVSREVGRNGGPQAYRAARADAQAWKAAQRPKPCKLATQPKLRRLVAKKLHERWSPRQISGWGEVKFSTSSRMYVSHETIYRTLAHSSPRRTREGIASAFEIAPSDAALSKLVPTWQGQGADPRRRRNRCRCLLLRPEEPVATRHERQHEPFAAPVLPQRPTHRWLHAAATQRGRSSTQPAPTPNLELLEPR